MNETIKHIKNTQVFECLRCRGLREVWVWKDTSETEKIRIDCPMCSPQRPPEELRDLGII